jgi:hypothetical protein
MGLKVNTRDDTMAQEKSPDSTLPLEGASDVHLFLEFYRPLSEELRLIRLRISNPFDELLRTQPSGLGNGDAVEPEPKIAMPDPVAVGTRQPASELHN